MLLHCAVPSNTVQYNLHRSRECSIAASYSRGFGLRSRHWNWILWYFGWLFSPFRNRPASYLKLAHSRFLSHSFQFIYSLITPQFHPLWSEDADRVVNKWINKILQFVLNLLVAKKRLCYYCIHFRWEKKQMLTHSGHIAGSLII
jgi:hypothetical protein